jgi:hypothetical protein
VRYDRSMKHVGFESKKRISFPTQLFAEGSTSVQIPSEIHVVPKGGWDHSIHGRITIDDAAIDQFIQNINASDYIPTTEVMMDLEKLFILYGKWPSFVYLCLAAASPALVCVLLYL